MATLNVILECGASLVVRDEGDPIGKKYLCREHEPDTKVPLLNPNKLFHHMSKAVRHG